MGAAFVTGADRALKEKCAYLICTAAGGARMQKGIHSLMQMPKTMVAVRRLAQAGLPYIVVLTDPTTAASPPAMPCWATFTLPSQAA